MNERLVSDKPVLISLLGIFALFILGFVVIGPAIGVAVASLFYEGDFLEAMMHPLEHPDIRNGILISQGIASGVGLVLLPWFYLTFIEKKSIRPFFKPEPGVISVFAILAFAVILLGVVISPLAEWNASFEIPGSFGAWARETETLAEGIIKMITSDLSPMMLVFSMVVIALVPAVGEELVFRGLIQNEMYRANKNPHVAIWLTAIIFSAIHLQFLGFVPRVLIGAFLGYLYFWSGNLLVPMIGHFLNNGIQLMGLYLYQQGALSYNIEETTSAPWVAVLLSIPMLGALLYYLKNYFTSQKVNPT